MKVRTTSCVTKLEARFDFSFFFFFFNDTATTEIYTLSLHDALPISGRTRRRPKRNNSMEVQAITRNVRMSAQKMREVVRSEEHTSELQSPCNLVCRLLLEKKND